MADDNLQHMRDKIAALVQHNLELIEKVRYESFLWSNAKQRYELQVIPSNGNTPLQFQATKHRWLTKRPYYMASILSDVFEPSHLDALGELRMLISNATINTLELVQHFCQQVSVISIVLQKVMPDKEAHVLSVLLDNLERVQVLLGKLDFQNDQVPPSKDVSTSSSDMVESCVATLNNKIAYLFDVVQHESDKLDELAFISKGQLIRNYTTSTPYETVYMDCNQCLQTGTLVWSIKLNAANGANEGKVFIGARMETSNAHSSGEVSTVMPPPPISFKKEANIANWMAYATHLSAGPIISVSGSLDDTKHPRWLTPNAVRCGIEIFLKTGAVVSVIPSQPVAGAITTRRFDTPKHVEPGDVINCELSCLDGTLTISTTYNHGGKCVLYAEQLVKAPSDSEYFGWVPCVALTEAQISLLSNK